LPAEVEKAGDTDKVNISPPVYIEPDVIATPLDKTDNDLAVLNIDVENIYVLPTVKGIAHPALVYTDSVK
jgi:hypothetical protein